MKKSIFLFVLLCPLFLHAQNHYIGIKAGGSFSNVSFSTDPIIDNFEYRSGLVAGFTYDFHFMKFLACGAELSYIQKGYQLDVLFTNEIGQEIGEGKLHYNYDYIQFPLKAGLVLGKRLSFVANIGIVPGFNIISKWKIPTDIEGQSEKNTKDKVCPFDIAGLAEIGADIKFAGRFKAILLATYQHSFNQFNKEDYFADIEMKHLGFSIAIGVKYALKK